VRVALHRGLRTLADDPAVRALAGRSADDRSSADRGIADRGIADLGIGDRRSGDRSPAGPSQARGRSGPEQTLWTLEEVD
jgi:hypothetical protein